MAKDYSIPYQDLINLVPKEHRNPMLRSLLDNLFNRFLTKDEGVPLYGYVGRKSTTSEKIPKIPQATNDRKINSLIPVLSFKLGSETVSFTPHDLIKKAEVLGVSSDLSWLYSQGNNYAPPIDLDKFTNFFNYVWIAPALPSAPSMAWNPTLAPEYYTIAAPAATDLDKLNVKTVTTASTTLTGTGYPAQTWTVTFSGTGGANGTADYFSVTSSAGITPSVPNPVQLLSNDQEYIFSTGAVELLRFRIVRDPIYDAFGAVVGTEAFMAGDFFTITAPFISSTYSVTFTGSAGIKGKITSINSRDVYQTINGVTVAEGDRVLVRNNTAVENGIYIVKPGAWVKADDFNSALGTAAAGARVFVTSTNQLFTSFSSGSGYGWNLTSTGSTFNNTNDWQETNYWVHHDDLSALGLNAALCVQATRPIIEFGANLKLNAFVSSAGLPADSGTQYKQTKTRFNQAPLFDLYRYNGVHANKTSTLFFYVEDPTADVDLELQRRVKLSANDSADFLFDHGMVEDNTLLFYKLTYGSLHTIWHPGYSTSQIVDQQFSGSGNGSLSLSVAGSDPYAPQQIWTLTALSSTQFTVSGSKTTVIPAPYDIITVNTPYSNGLFTCTITSGSTPFAAGDTFTFRQGNFETCRYVTLDSNENVIDIFGGPAGDINSEGAWQIPRMWYNNLSAKLSGEVPEGTLYSHFRGIMNNQPPGATMDKAFGGSIKLWSEQVNLISSLLMQRDVTPLSLIDLAEKQYSTSTNALVELFVREALQYITDNGIISDASSLNAFVDYLLSIRAQDHDVKTILFDSTSPVVGFPPTLPQLGVVPLVFPELVFNNELGATLFKKHDGSLMPLFQNSTAFNDQFGPPGTPIPQDLAALLNAVLENIELRLYDGISTQHRTYFTSNEIETALTGNLKSHLEAELAQWAVQNGYDPTAGDYTSGDAFTWNYSSAFPASFAAVASSTVPARWWKALQSHQATVAGVISTSRPDLEPWKLLGHAVDPGASWDIYRAIVTPADIDQGGFTSAAPVRLVSYSTTSLNTSLSGLGIIDGKSLNTGDRVLLVSELVPAHNGVWIASSSTWTRASDALTANTVFEIQDGNIYSGSSWVLLNTPVNVNTSAKTFTQVRLWTDAMWTAIKVAKPTLRLSVNTFRDTLLPPYVNASLPTASEALTTTIPPLPNSTYEFGEGSPVETVWTNTSEFLYSLARAVFKSDPLAFLGFMWGFEWVEVDGILYDAFDVSMPSETNFRLHGDAISSPVRTAPIALSLVTGPANMVLTFTRDAYTAARAQSWTIRDQTGLFLGYVQQGITYPTVTTNGYTFTGLRLNDEGHPFRVGDVITVSANANGSGMNFTFTPAQYAIFNGFNQLFAQALRANSINTTFGYPLQAFRGWGVNLGYRAGGLVSTDDLNVFIDDVKVADSAFNLRFKKSPYSKDLWVQGLRVTVTQIGSAYKDKNDLAVASNDASDWTFRVEGYNPRHLGVEYYNFDVSGAYSTFNVLNSTHTPRAFKHFSDVSSISTAQLPFSITGLQNLVNFLFGYSDRLTDLGWQFNDPDAQNVDAETGRLRDWQLEIEKLIDRVYAGIDYGQGHVLNPFMDRVWINHPTGLVSEFFDSVLFDVSAHPAAFDVLGAKISADNLLVLRGRERTQIGAAVPMMSLHAQLDEYEHLFVFNNYAESSTNSGLIYDPFSGARVTSVKFKGRKQGSFSLRPEFGGHYLVGNEVKRNLQSSADKISQYYDADHAFEDELSTKHALALLGYSPKDYMADLDLTDKSQFNFWRGLIQMKGTNVSIDAFLNNNRFEDASLDEYWAYKIAEYGDSRSKIYPELKLTVSDAIQQFTKLQFDSGTLAATGFTTISSTDETRWFSIDDLDIWEDQPVTFAARQIGVYARDITAGEIITIPFIADAISAISGPVSQINGNTFIATANGSISLAGYGPYTPKFNPIKLINYVDHEVVEEIPLWHPAIGQHTPAALGAINVISTLDPARYNVSTLVSGNSNYDPLRTWGAKELGRVWWDTSNLAYVPYADPIIYSTVDERLNRWGRLADYASIDVVEWVESKVPPSEYAAQAAIDAGDADIDASVKADGEVYGAKVYQRERTWAIRPIAWSQASKPAEDAHISGMIGSRGQFYADYDSGLHITSSGLAILETVNFADLDISVGMRFGAFEDTKTNLRARSENIITSFTKVICKGTGDEYTLLEKFNDPVTPSVFDADHPISGTVSGLTGVISHSIISSTLARGELLFTTRTTETMLYDADGVATGDSDFKSYLRLRIPGTVFDEEILVNNVRGTSATPASATSAYLADQIIAVDFSTIGITFRIAVSSTATVQFDTVAEFLKQLLTTAELSMFDAAKFENIAGFIDLPSDNFENPHSYSSFLTNDFTNTDSHADASGEGGIGWRAWNAPTQEQLDADSRYPNSEWYPMVGPAFPVSPTISQIQEGATAQAFYLNNGKTIPRYETSWDNWIALETKLFSTVSTVTGDVELALDDGSSISIDRISVYVNGVARLSETYELNGTTLTVFGVPQGHIVVAAVRPYAPTSDELKFDPLVEDNLLVQRQYKVDYQYVELPVRDHNGVITGMKYYFWVKNRSTAARRKNLSVSAISKLLEDGPDQYLTFQNIQQVAGNWVYDAITISGLSYVVTKDDTFKLRFTRNFTLRDDPQDHDQLKDTHTEWGLIRPGQRTKIPEMLWNKLVNTACGVDAAGNSLPSARRIAYDERNGTNTRFGFGADQILAPTELVLSTILFTILNTKVVDDNGSVSVPDYMTFLDFTQEDKWFSTAQNTRNTLTRIWNEGKVSQINEIFFAVLEEICAAQYEMSDIFKTSRLSAYSIKVVSTASAVPTYE